MRVVALLDVFGGKLNLADLVRFAFAIERADLELIALNRDDIEIVQVNGVAGVSDNCADIAGQKIFLFADAEHERAATTRSDHETGNVGVNQSDAISANDLFQRAAHGIDQTHFGILAIEPLINAANEMRQHFGVGVRPEIFVTVLN